MSNDRTQTSDPADAPPAEPGDASEMDAADLGPHAPASPYPKTEKAPETGGYEAPPQPSGAGT